MLNSFSSLLTRNIYVSEISLINFVDGDSGCEGNSLFGYFGLLFWGLFAIFLFLGIYVLCEEHFVPLLTLLGEKMKLPQDVCGATLLAVGGSSPELFTALIGVFFYPTENPGPATNCGSNAFNMCVVIGLSILFSGQNRLKVAGYPFIRDSFFYVTVALQLYIFYEWKSPGLMEMWESFLLVLTWIMYVIALYNNEIIISILIQIFERLHLKVPPSLLFPNMEGEETTNCNKYMKINSEMAVVPSCMDMQPEYENIKSDSPEASEDNMSELSLCLLDSSTEDDHYPDKYLKSYDAINSTRLDNARKKLVKPKNKYIKEYSDDLETDLSTYKQFARSHENALIQIMQDQQSKIQPEITTTNTTTTITSQGSNQRSPCLISKMPPNTHRKDNIIIGKPITTMEIAASVAPPRRWYESSNMQRWKWLEVMWNKLGTCNLDPIEVCTHGLRVLNICAVPFRSLFSWSVPALPTNTTNNENISSNRLGAVFAVCILWLAVLTFLVVDCANKIGSCCRLTAEVMGITLLAIGTSLPDCFSSILVAKAGKGTMAVSSALGGNVFDIGICAGLSFFLKSLLSGGQPIRVEGGASYEAFMIGLFFLFALLVVCMYRAKLQLDKYCGYVLLGAYFIFLISFSVVLDL